MEKKDIDRCAVFEVLAWEHSQAQLFFQYIIVGCKKRRFTVYFSRQFWSTMHCLPQAFILKSVLSTLGWSWTWDVRSINTRQLCAGTLWSSRWWIGAACCLTFLHQNFCEEEILSYRQHMFIKWFICITYCRLEQHGRATYKKIFVLIDFTFIWLQHTNQLLIEMAVCDGTRFPEMKHFLSSCLGFFDSNDFENIKCKPGLVRASGDHENLILSSVISIHYSQTGMCGSFHTAILGLSGLQHEITTQRMKWRNTF